MEICIFSNPNKNPHILCLLPSGDGFGPHFMMKTKAKRKKNSLHTPKSMRFFFVREKFSTHLLLQTSLSQIQFLLQTTALLLCFPFNAFRRVTYTNYSTGFSLNLHGSVLSPIVSMEYLSGLSF